MDTDQKDFVKQFNKLPIEAKLMGIYGMMKESIGAGNYTILPTVEIIHQEKFQLALDMLERLAVNKCNL